MFILFFTLSNFWGYLPSNFWSSVEYTRQFEMESRTIKLYFGIIKEFIKLSKINKILDKIFILLFYFLIIYFIYK